MAKLNAALSAVQRAETATRQAQARLKRYRAAVLHAAVTGELTREWREAQRKSKKANLETGEALLRRLLTARRIRWEEAELERLRAAGKEAKDDKWKLRYPEPARPNTGDLTELSETWTWATVDQITTMIATGATPYRGNPAYWEGGKIAWVTSGAMNKELITSADGFITDLAIKETNAKVFPAGTLLLALYGEGKTRGMVSELGIEAATNQACAALLFAKYNEKQRPYLKLFLEKNYEDVRRLSSGGVQPNLNLSIVRQTHLPLPPTDEQTEIVREVERRLVAANQLTSSLDRQLERAFATRQTLLLEAFVGRLVPQNPNDEPASILLERIRATREAEAQKPKAKRMPKSKSEMKPAERRTLLTVLKENGRPMTPEELFQASGYTQESVDQFFAELRELTATPTRIAEERSAEGLTLLKAIL